MSQPEMQFEPAPGSVADLDYELWVKYLEVCEKDGTSPTIRDFLVWMDEQDVVHTS